MKATSIATLLLLPLFNTFAGPILIGYSNAVSVSHFSPSLMEQVGQLRWFFVHASVGENILSGLESLKASQPDFYRLTRTSEDDQPPATTLAGSVYDYQRGNPPWQAKVDDFAGYVSNGWHYPLVDAVLNKLCFLDQDADVNYYLSHSAAIESANPGTWFIYATIPLTFGEDENNYLRNVFNDSLRAWVRANGRVLYDLADMEAHDTNGVPQTFVYNGRLCQKLFSGYTSDGGHLETADAQQLVAKGLYALGAALINYGIPDMKLRPCGWSGGTFQLEFYASTNVQYTVQCCSNLAVGSWQTLATLLPRTQGCTVLLMDGTASAPSRFYRIWAEHR